MDAEWELATGRASCRQQGDNPHNSIALSSCQPWQICPGRSEHWGMSAHSGTPTGSHNLIPTSVSVPSLPVSVAFPFAKPRFTSIRLSML